MDPHLNDPESALAFALAGDLRALVGKLKRKLREQAGPGDVSPSQIAVLLRLERDGPATLSSLARGEGMRPQSMGTLTAPLEAADLIAGAPDPNDGRQTLLSLSAHGRAWIAARRAARQDWLFGMIRARLTAQEQATLADAVDLLKRLTDD
jgi:DNA-binding MarR family transcriptional regulator